MILRHHPAQLTVDGCILQRQIFAVIGGIKRAVCLRVIGINSNRIGAGNDLQSAAQITDQHLSVAAGAALPNALAGKIAGRSIVDHTGELPQFLQSNRFSFLVKQRVLRADDGVQRAAQYQVELQPRVLQLSQCQRLAVRENRHNADLCQPRADLPDHIKQHALFQITGELILVVTGKHLHKSIVGQRAVHTGHRQMFRLAGLGCVLQISKTLADILRLMVDVPAKRRQHHTAGSTLKNRRTQFRLQILHGGAQG